MGDYSGAQTPRFPHQSFPNVKKPLSKWGKGRGSLTASPKWGLRETWTWCFSDSKRFPFQVLPCFSPRRVFLSSSSRVSLKAEVWWAVGKWKKEKDSLRRSWLGLKAVWKRLRNLESDWNQSAVWLLASTTLWVSAQQRWKSSQRVSGALRFLWKSVSPWKISHSEKTIMRNSQCTSSHFGNPIHSHLTTLSPLISSFWKWVKEKWHHWACCFDT